MAKPSTVATWATDTNIVTGTEAGTPTKVEPSAGYKAQGLVPGDTFVGPYVNWLWNNLSSWAAYLNNLHGETEFLNKAYTWTAAHVFNAGLTTTTAAATTVNATNVNATNFQAQGAGEYTYQSRTTTKLVPISADETLGVNAWHWSPDGQYWFCNDGSEALSFKIPLPHGATLLEVRLGVIQGSVSSAGQEMVGRARHIRYNKAVAIGGSSSGQTVLDTRTLGSVGTGFRILNNTVSWTVDSATDYIVVRVLSCDTCNASDVDELHWCEVTFTDPGPRNK